MHLNLQIFNGTTEDGCDGILMKFDSVFKFLEWHCNYRQHYRGVLLYSCC